MNPLKTRSRVVLTIIAGFLTVMFATAGLTQSAKKTSPKPVQKPAAAAKPAASAYRAQSFSPGFDDLMTMLVQPRHAKLYYAGSAKNWELAAAEARDLRSSFDRIAQTIPNYEGNDVSLSIRDLIASRIDAVDTAIAAADSQKFAAAYKDLTAGCNECHSYMEHPFLVISAPNPADQGSAYPDQDFNARP